MTAAPGAERRGARFRWECSACRVYPALLGIVDDNGVLEIKGPSEGKGRRPQMTWISGDAIVVATCRKCGAENTLVLRQEDSAKLSA